MPSRSERQMKKTRKGQGSNIGDMKRFADTFNKVWYKDFPISKKIMDSGAADWTHHIGTCVRRAAHRLGYFARFEVGKFDAAITKISDGDRIANVEWEWMEPGKHTKETPFNEVKKLKTKCEDVHFSVLITWSREDKHKTNLKKICKQWKTCTKPLLLFVLRFGKEKRGGGRSRAERLEKLETRVVTKGISKSLGEQKPFPWKALE